MQRGLSVPEDMPLGRVGQDHPATRAKLQEIERRAFERSGRLDALRKEAGLPVATASVATKQKIISRLAKKTTARKAAPITAKSPAKAKKR